MVLPAGIFIFTGVAHGAVNLALLGVVAARQQRLLPCVTVAALGVNAALAFASLELGLGLVGLAAGALVGRLCYAWGIVALVSRAVGTRPTRAAASVLWPIVWCASVMTLVSVWQAPRDGAAFAFALACYALLTAPVAIALARAVARNRPSRAIG